MQPPNQELVVRDLHDNTYTFRHIYRGKNSLVLSFPFYWVILVLIYVENELGYFGTHLCCK